MTDKILPVPNSVTSYWLNEPSEYADLRSTPSLPENMDVTVVGTGLSGVLTAYWILRLGDEKMQKEREGKNRSGVEGAEKKEGVRVLLLEARRLCSGATGRNGGHIKAQVSTLLNLPHSDSDGGKKRSEFQDYVIRIMNELKHIADLEGIQCELEFRRSSCMTDTQLRVPTASDGHVK